MKAPFPWFGGKSKAADLIWSRFGDVDNYVEPFAGSLAVLLARPHWPFSGAARTETVNDVDAYVVNFWRAIQADPEAVAIHADNPVNEVDLHARRQCLTGNVTFSPPVARCGLSASCNSNFLKPNRTLKS